MKEFFTLRAFLIFLTMISLNLFSGSALIANPESPIKFYSKKDQLVISPAKSYVIISYNNPWSLFLVRMLREDEITSYLISEREARAKFLANGGEESSFRFQYNDTINFFALQKNRSFEKVGKFSTVVAQVEPGTYVIYGHGNSVGSKSYLYQCFCYGTVGFVAKPGEILDLGFAFTEPSSKPSIIPELKNEVNLGKSMSLDFVHFTTALRSRDKNEQLSSNLSTFNITKPNFFAVGHFIEPNAKTAGRLAPIPGILSYRLGEVIDERTGQAVRPNF